MGDPLPILFIHRRNSPYLPFTLGQAKMRSPDSQVILLGDSTNNVFPFVKHVAMERHSAAANEFDKIYRHLSPNGDAYELFCFQRWFILRDFLRAADIERLVHVDSDVLLYVDVNQEQENWRDHSLTLVRGVCAGNMFINHRAAIEELCDVIWDLYAGKHSAQRLDALYQERQKTAEGISDMVALKLYYDANRNKVAEMTGLQPNHTWWDANIHLSEGFELHDGRKRTRFLTGNPHCRQIATGQEIRFNCLHFQGGAKKHIEAAYRQGLDDALAA